MLWTDRNIPPGLLKLRTLILSLILRVPQTICQASASSAFSFTSKLLKSILYSQAQCTADAIARQAQSNADAMEHILAKFASAVSPALSITSDSGVSRSSLSITTPKKVKVLPWTDDQKKAMVCNGEPKSRWGHLLPIYISGKLESAFHSEIPTDMMTNFNEVKSKLLKSLGDTPSMQRDGGGQFPSSLMRTTMLSSSI